MSCQRAYDALGAPVTASGRSMVVQQLLANNVTQTTPDVEKGKLQDLLDTCALLHLSFSAKLLTDARWRDAITAAATAAAGSTLTKASSPFAMGGGYGGGGGYGVGASLSLESMLDVIDPRTMRVAVRRPASSPIPCARVSLQAMPTGQRDGHVAS